jgi:hypothetical protein
MKEGMLVRTHPCIVRACAVVFLLLLCAPSFGQTDALTIEQCRKDQKQWLSKLDPPDPVFDDDPRLPVWDEQSRQYNEMHKCKSVDPAHYAEYYQTDVEIMADQSIRMGRFMRRHNLVAQYRREGGAGDTKSNERDSEITVHRTMQMEQFLKSHNLFSQFRREDALIHKKGSEK